MDKILKTPWIEKKPSSLRYYQDGPPSEVNIDSWKLQISLPDDSVAIDIGYDELKSIPQRIENRRVVCVCNWSIRRTWMGFYLQDLFDHLQIDLGVFKDMFLKQISIGTPEKGQYDTTVRLDDALKRNAMFILGVDGEPLPIEQGFPLRFIDFGLYGYKSVKGLSEIQITDEFKSGHWEAQAGYCKEGRVKPKKYRIIDLRESQFIEKAEVTEF